MDFLVFRKPFDNCRSIIVGIEWIHEQIVTDAKLKINQFFFFVLNDNVELSMCVDELIMKNLK